MRYWRCFGAYALLMAGMVIGKYFEGPLVWWQYLVLIAAGAACYFVGRPSWR